MNIDHVKLCTRQTYNIQTATSLEKDAIQGSIVLYPVVYNADKTTQNLRQHFLVLRPSHSLSTPLLGVDFLTNNQVFMNFKDSNFVVQVNGIKLSLSQTNPTMTEERFLPTYNADVKSSVKSGSTRSNPPNHFLLSVLIVPSSQPQVSELCVKITVSQAILNYFRFLPVHSETYCNLPSTFSQK